MGNIGLVLNRQEEAQSLMIDMENRIKVVEEKIMDQYIPQVLYIEEIDDNGYIFSAGKESWFNTLLELAGGVNLDHKETQTINSIETLHLLDPDYILVPAGEGVMEQLSLLEGYENLRAYQEGKIIPFNEEFLKIQGPRLADGLLELAKIIHPDIVFE